MTIEEFLEQYAQRTGKTNLTAKEFQDLVSQYTHSSNMDPSSFQGFLAEHQGNPLLGNYSNAEYEKYLDNEIANQRTQETRAWEEEQASQDLLRAGSQLEQLGLSSSGVLQTGGSSTNAVAAADNSKTNLGMQRYAQKMAIAKQLLSMTSSMASAGVYGGAYLAAKKASGVLASQAAHSARVVTNYNGNNVRTGLSISQTVPEDFDFSRLL